MIPIAKPYLPERKKLDKYIDGIYENNWLTNNGPLVQTLTGRLAEYLNIDSGHVVLVANGSLALHMAYKALELQGEVITTPFSFIATSSTLVWEGLTPVFSDIDPCTWNIDPDLIEEKITRLTSAIVPVHVFGNPCDIDAIQVVANNHKLKVIYDASHCFGTEIDGKSILECGDVSTISFHATKLFHSVEGGALIVRDKLLADKIRKMINFGAFGSNNIEELGTNAKMSELHAAMGMAVLDEINEIEVSRARIWNCYSEALSGFAQLQKRHPESNNNHAYFPVVLESEQQVLGLIEMLANEGIQARRYFNPTLDKMFGTDIYSCCVVSNAVSAKVVCLPLYSELSLSEINQIVRIVKSVNHL